jgi:hypothetical protein
MVQELRGRGKALDVEPDRPHQPLQGATDRRIVVEDVDDGS